MINFHFSDGDVYRSTSSGVYTFQLVRFARMSGRTSNFNARDKGQGAPRAVFGLSLDCGKTFMSFYRKFYKSINEIFEQISYSVFQRE